MTDPKPGQRARLTIAEAILDDDGFWAVLDGGGDYFIHRLTPGLSWEALPDPLPGEDRMALYVDGDGNVWQHNVTVHCWFSPNLVGLSWERLVRERGPLRRYTLDET